MYLKYCKISVLSILYSTCYVQTDCLNFTWLQEFSSICQCAFLETCSAFRQYLQKQECLAFLASYVIIQFEVLNSQNPILPKYVWNINLDYLLLYIDSICPLGHIGFSCIYTSLGPYRIYMHLYVPRELQQANMAWYVLQISSATRAV